MSVEIVPLAAPLSDRALDELAEVLADCVEGGASVNFMSPYSRVRHATSSTRSQSVSRQAISCCSRRGSKAGSSVPYSSGSIYHPTSAHRADVKKMLVHRSTRGRGVGAALMSAIEDEARRRGRWLLVLDTVPGESGHRLYLRAGWQQSGTVPDYALFPDGRLCDTAFMWKRLK